MTANEWAQTCCFFVLLDFIPYWTGRFFGPKVGQIIKPPYYRFKLASACYWAQVVFEAFASISAMFWLALRVIV